jgi:uncharacterized protein YndB with AHSA1/START domain
MSHDPSAAPGISIRRRFEAPRDRVYAAWTTPQHFAIWFGGSAAEVPVDSVLMDVSPGGQWRATMFAGPARQHIPWSGRYLEVDAPGRLVFTLADRPGDEHELVTVVLDDADGATQMEFTQVGGHMDADGYAQARAGWLTFFDTMDALLAGR